MTVAVTAKLISAFVFAIRIVQSLYYLAPKFQASSHLLWLYSPVCVAPDRKHQRPVFSERGSITPMGCLTQPHILPFYLTSTNKFINTYALMSDPLFLSIFSLPTKFLQVGVWKWEMRVMSKTQLRRHARTLGV